MKRILHGLLLVLCIIMWSSCVEPSPLYGTWADNRGNSLSFFNDGNFNAAIARASQGKDNYSGSYTVNLNSLTLNCSGVSLRVVTEWDIRGNMLYLDWPSDTGTKALTLYKISN